MIRNSVVLATALVPTIGHIELVKFACRMTSEKVLVFVQCRTFEPVGGLERKIGIFNSLTAREQEKTIVIHTYDDEAPQNPDPIKEAIPGGDKEFWEYWRRAIVNELPYTIETPDQRDAVIASEQYGAVLADYLNTQFIPHDIAREIIPVKGTDVRQDMDANWNLIAPGFRPFLKTNIVIFGQESVGKTTMARELAARDDMNQQHFIPEYARGYLETVGAELSSEKMQIIAKGQWALQQLAVENADYHTNIFDTDLLSTIGYHRIQGNNPEEIDPGILSQYGTWKHFNDPIYFLMPDDIPFEEDQLRYGGDKRESTYTFWLDLLRENQCTYHMVPRGNFDKKLNWIQERIDEYVDRKFEPIRLFERE